MERSVKDNTRYRCLGCGRELDQADTLKPCPDCEKRRFEQVVVTECCDFCSTVIDGEAGVWTHYTHAHTLPLPDGRAQMQGREWAACAVCHRLITAGDSEGLVDRAVGVHAALHPEVPRHVLRLATMVPHAGFWANVDTDRPPHRGDPTEAAA